MKAQIIKVKGFWRLLYYRPDRAQIRVAVYEDYLFFDGAVFRWNRIQERIKRENKAWDKILYELQSRYVSVKENELIAKLLKQACRNITRRQYGYLTGIIERQKQNV